MAEDWPILMSFFPDHWEELAATTNALKGLHKNKEAENYLRTLMLHIAGGYSLRETVARAKLSGLADLSDVAFLFRLAKAKEWLRQMCVELFAQSGVAAAGEDVFQVRLFDATTVKEPGPTGSHWRIHYSLRLPSLACDYFRITAAKGEGSGESFFQFAIKKGDYLIADRGYCTSAGIGHVAAKKAYVLVRVNSSTLTLLNPSGEPFSLLDQVSTLERAGRIGSWPVLSQGRDGASVAGRICAVRKTEQAIQLAHEKLALDARRKGKVVKPTTYEFAKYVIVFTTFPTEQFSAFAVLEWYRRRWQIELVFKRFKSIAQLGHLPKERDDSALAWLYGKLFVALLTERLMAYASAISPWGYDLQKGSATERLARV
jgi:Transposase DDE domain